MQYVRTDDGWGIVTSRELSRLQQVEIETPIGTVTVLNPIEEPQGRPDEARSDTASLFDEVFGAIEADCARFDAEFNEADHPRGENGQFGSGTAAGRSIESIKRVIASIERLANHPGTPPAEAAIARERLAALKKQSLAARFATYVPLDAPGEPGYRGDDAEFNEEDHPRAEDGKFGSGGGTAKSKARLEPAKTNRHGVHVTAAGSPLPAHIAALKIPPAWTDVHYDTNPGAALLVAGRDAKGRAVAIYSAEHSAKAAATKYARIRELNAEFDRIVAQNEAARRDPATRDVADCLALVMATGIRPGRDADTGAAVRAYGATTLEGRHVRVSPNGHVSLQFIGKKGVSLNIPVSDPSLATMLIKRKTNAGPKGLIFETVNDRSLRKHSDAMDGGGFKTKDFRTHLGTSVASKLVASAKPPTDERSYKRAVRQIAAEVAAKLGNTPTVALQSYISPSVFSEWRMAANV
jgi:DNA topoisomerase I